MAKALPLILVGLGIVYGGVAELAAWLRSRGRLRRVTAEIVGLHELAAVNPGGRGRSAVFRFTTDDGHVVEAISSLWTFPEPRIGRRIPVTYDPADPQGTAEREGVRVVKAALLASANAHADMAASTRSPVVDNLPYVYAWNECVAVPG